jgi:hypothetical protein
MPMAVRHGNDADRSRVPAVRRLLPTAIGGFTRAPLNTMIEPHHPLAVLATRLPGLPNWRHDSTPLLTQPTPSLATSATNSPLLS